MNAGKMTVASPTDFFWAFTPHLERETGFYAKNMSTKLKPEEKKAEVVKTHMNASPVSNASITAMRLPDPLALSYDASETLALACLRAFRHRGGIVIDEQWEGEHSC